jgi:hypothetical protein
VLAVPVGQKALEVHSGTVDGEHLPAPAGR